MKAVLAYFQGKFNNCHFDWLSTTQCKITLVDNSNSLKGSFIAKYDENRAMVDVTDDTEMKPIKLATRFLPPTNE